MAVSGLEQSFCLAALMELVTQILKVVLVLKKLYPKWNRPAIIMRMSLIIAIWLSHMEQKKCMKKKATTNIFRQ